MAEAQLSFEQRKTILKWYLKLENVVEGQRQWRREYAALTLNLPTTTIVAQPFNVIKWQLKFNPVA